MQLHTSLALGPLQNRWPDVSSSSWHSLQQSSCSTCLRTRFFLVSKMSWHALHMKCRTLCGACICHSNFQNFLVWLSSELEPLFAGRERFIANLYAIRTLNNLFALSAHISLSSGGCILNGMLLIHSASCGRNNASINCAFYWVESWAINSHTFVSTLKNILGDTTWYVDVDGNHLSPHTRMDVPLPTLHRLPCFTKY